MGLTFISQSVFSDTTNNTSQPKNLSYSPSYGTAHILQRVCVYDTPTVVSIDTPELSWSLVGYYGSAPVTYEIGVWLGQSSTLQDPTSALNITLNVSSGVIGRYNVLSVTGVGSAYLATGSAGTNATPITPTITTREGVETLVVVSTRAQGTATAWPAGFTVLSTPSAIANFAYCVFPPSQTVQAQWTTGAGNWVASLVAFELYNNITNVSLVDFL